MAWAQTTQQEALHEDVHTRKCNGCFVRRTLTGLMKEDNDMLRLILIASLLVAIAHFASAESNVSNGAAGGGWVHGRASWYGTPKPFVDSYVSTRGGGESAFGVLEVCGNWVDGEGLVTVLTKHPWVCFCTGSGADVVSRTGMAPSSSPKRW